MTNNETHCVTCNEPFAQFATKMTTGYGTDPDTKERHCFPCCGVKDKETMVRDGKYYLYLKSGAYPWSVSNWPGTLKFNVCANSEGRHNMTGKRYDVWFNGPDGFIWHGTQYGDNTEVCHVKRTKKTSL